jgi:hypothetical protein
MTLIRDNLVSRKMHALRAAIWRNLRVLLVRRKLSNCEPGSQNCEPGSQFRIVNQTALHPIFKPPTTALSIGIILKKMQIQIMNFDLTL